MNRRLNTCPNAMMQMLKYSIWNRSSLVFSWLQDQTRSVSNLFIYNHFVIHSCICDFNLMFNTSLICFSFFIWYISTLRFSSGTCIIIFHWSAQFWPSVIRFQIWKEILLTTEEITSTDFQVSKEAVNKENQPCFFTILLLNFWFLSWNRWKLYNNNAKI